MLMQGIDWEEYMEIVLYKSQLALYAGNVQAKNVFQLTDAITY